MTVVHLRAAPGKGWCSRSFPGELRQVRAARQFVGRSMAGCPARETLLTCVSELAANAIEHTASGAGGAFTVTTGKRGDGAAYVEVTDDGGVPGEPAVQPGEGFAERGRGLALVAACSSRWGYREDGHGRRTVWAEVTWPVRVRQPGGKGEGSAGMWDDEPINAIRPVDVA